MPVLVPHTKLAALLGEKTMQSSATTVQELLREAERRVPPAEWAQAMRCIILVNGRSVHLVDGLRTALQPDDQVWMVFPASGG
ncbi:MAG TPA: MoaD/ThiS family protein [Polyangia bacterium]|jgi:molybdopterin converting factor small subunit